MYSLIMAYRDLSKVIPSTKGTYVILLRIDKVFRDNVGSLGMVMLEPGLYVYIGSACGYGGLKSRILRHINKEKKIRWHIDYITSKSFSKVVAIAYTFIEKSLEECISRILEYSPLFSIAWPKFGCSDKHSKTHLYRCRSNDVIKCIDACVEAFISCRGNRGFAHTILLE